MMPSMYKVIIKFMVILGKFPGNKLFVDVIGPYST